MGSPRSHDQRTGNRSMLNRATQVLLNVGHAIDHMFLLIFATAVTAIAQDFGMARWEDLMPWGVLAFFCFGLGSLPSGKLGDQWGRRKMMLVFFFGMGASAIAVSLTQTPWQLALALGLLGCFASIYHPVGIPMLVQGAQRPGWTIGVNGLSGNLGLALAAVVTGLLVKHVGWRGAFILPGLVSLLCGLLFARCAPAELQAPARKPASPGAASGASVARLLLIMTLAATTASLLFNFSTNSNYEMLADRLQQATRDPAQIGLLLAAVYTLASLSQLLVGALIDRFPLKPLYLSILVLQVLCLLLATQAGGWTFYALQFLFMATIFGIVPFTEAMMVRFVDDRIRSRVAGMRLAVSLGASSLAVWLIGPVVKQAGFSALLWVMCACGLLTLAVVSQLPRAPVR